MPSQKDILINVQANTAEVIRGLARVTAELQKISQSSAKLQTTSSAVTSVANATMRLGNSANTASSAMQKLYNSLDPRKVQEAADAWDTLRNTYENINPFGGIRDFGAEMGRILDPTKLVTAAGYRLAYGLVDLPGRAINAVTQGVKREIESTQQLEGEIFDLQAYMGGVGGKDLETFAKAVGAVGDSEQLTTAAMQKVQEKILSIGQSTSFTSLEIAKAMTEASKAGVSLTDIFGDDYKSAKGAMEAISLLSQNTGEPLEESARNVSKLQAAFETNLNKSQIAFGQTADSAAQYTMIVDSMAQADASSAASASQLTEALFNVGGSANNINMSFFDTLSLASAMVPAFESAASAGTSLKYVFSRMTGAGSIKAKESMQSVGLMDAQGQSVFFDPKTGFKGMEFMVRTLREKFGDQAGMAVDLRNKIITEIFGQDALKAVSRMVSMTEEQAQEMYKQSADMTAGAKAGVNYAQKTADIKNEGLEFDLEYLRGSLDSLSKTMTMPLLKPMSAVTQSISGVANGMFAILTGASRTSDSVNDAFEMIDRDMFPNAMNLFQRSLDYAESLKVGLDAITKTGFNAKSIATAIAALMGTPKDSMAARVAEYEILLKNLHARILQFIDALPDLLAKARDFIGSAIDGLVRGFTWIMNNWDSVVTGLKIIAAFLVADWVITATNNWIAMGRAIDDAIVSLAGKNIREIVAGFGTKNPGVAGAAAQGAATVLTAPRNANTWAAVGTGINTAMLNIKTTLISLIAPLSRLVGWFMTLFAPGGLAAAGSAIMTALGTALTFLLSPLMIVIGLIAAMAAAWYFNVGGIADYLSQEFGWMGEYISDTFNLIVQSIKNAWGGISSWMSSGDGQAFLIGFSTMLKGVWEVVKGIVYAIGGTLKVLVGIFTMNGDLIKSGMNDNLRAIYTFVKGVVNAIIGVIQAATNWIVMFINWIGSFFGAKELIGYDGINNMFKGASDWVSNLFDGGTKSGNEYSKGLALGIDQSSKDVKKSAGRAAEAAIDMVNKEWIIKSPSKYAEDQGYNFGEGLAIGLENSIVLIENASKSVANALMRNMETELTVNYRAIRDYQDKEMSRITNLHYSDAINQSGYIDFVTTPEQQTEPTFTRNPSQRGYYMYPGAQKSLPKPYTHIADPGTYNKFILKYDDWGRKTVKEMIKLDKIVNKINWETIPNVTAIRERLNQANPHLRQGTNRLPVLPAGESYETITRGLNTYVIDKFGKEIKVEFDEFQDVLKEGASVIGNGVSIYSDYVTSSQGAQQLVNKLYTENKTAYENALKYGPSTSAMVAASGGKYSPLSKDNEGYYVGGVYIPGNRYEKEYDRSAITRGYSKSYTTYRQKTSEEFAAMQRPDYLQLTQLPVNAMRGDFANLPLDQFSTPEYDVAKGVKQFQFATGDRAIAQRGLTDMFANEDIANQFANIGDRAATYLSMRQGQLKPNEVIVYKQLLEQDRQDRIAYMDAVRVAKEQIAAGGDANAIIQNLINTNQSKTQTYKDIFDVKISSLKDYTAETGGAFDQYAKLGPQAFNEAMSVALDPANQSEAFKALSPEARQQLIDSVQNLPSQAMAFLGDAMADGTLDSTEFDTYMQYVGEDIANMRNILMRGTPPTQEELDAAFNPFIDGAATLVKSDQVTGVLGQALVGASTMIFNAMGKEAYDAFLKGWTTNEKGEKVAIGPISYATLLPYDPETLKTTGVPIGQGIFSGIVDGLKRGLIEEDYHITEIYGPDGELVKVIREKAKIKSPSEVFRDEVGLNIGLGIAEGLKLPEVLTAFGTNVLSLLNVASSTAYGMLILQSAQLYGAFLGKNMIEGLKSYLSPSANTSPFEKIILEITKEIRVNFQSSQIYKEVNAIGQNMAFGIIDGFQAAGGNIGAKISDVLSKQVPKTVSFVLQMASPSRLYANKIGKPIVEGVALGITKNSSSVSDALNPLLSGASYSPDISGAAVNGMVRRSQMQPVSSSVENNYNLSLATTYPGQTVQQQFEIMRAFKGRR